MTSERMTSERGLSDLSDVLGAARDAVIEAMEHGLIILDGEKRVLDINPAAERIVGLPMKDVVGRPASELLGGRSDLIDLLEGSEEGSKEIVVGEGSREQVFEVQLSSRCDRAGEPMGCYLFFQDVTERKRIEDALREAKEAAEASDRAKSEFMSVASHEMRTPITSIKGYTDLLSRETVGPINEAQTEFLDTIRSNADRIALLISDLSDIARIESGRLRLELGRVDVPSIIREAAESLRNQVEARDQALRIDVPDGLPAVWADQERSVQALSNLISNANKFTPPGGRIDVRAELWEEGRGVLIAVEDNGIGIRRDEQERVFERFYRSEDRKASDMPGSGLGLCIASNLVRMQGGEIWLKSTFREGTRVCFTLPVSESS